jgi:hypothetical protein
VTESEVQLFEEQGNEISSLQHQLTAISEVNEKLIKPLCGWNSRLRRGATSIPTTLENQIEAAYATIKRLAAQEPTP